MNYRHPLMGVSVVISLRISCLYVITDTSAKKGVEEILVVEHHGHEEHEELFGFGLLGGYEYAGT